MGATTFSTISKGKTAKDAFRAAVEAAQYENGHGGYTGTIAEKREFTMIHLPADFEADKPARERCRDFAHKLIDDGDSRIDDKWGPAGCIAVDSETFLFFGWASC